VCVISAPCDSENLKTKENAVLEKSVLATCYLIRSLRSSCGRASTLLYTLGQSLLSHPNPGPLPASLLLRRKENPEKL
jgi:hypothetical protein